MSEPLINALAMIDRHYEDRLLAARAWVARGGRVVGYLCDNVPDELIAAAGFLPLRLSGDPQSGTQAVRRHIDVLYPPDVTERPAFVASILNRVLDGSYNAIDYLVVPHNRNAIQAIYRQLKDAQRFNPTLRIPTLHYLDKAWVESPQAQSYNRARLQDFRAALEQWSNAPIESSALREAIDAADENRRLLAQVLQLRAGHPPRLSGVQALKIIATSMFMSRREHNALLESILAEQAMLPQRSGPRIFMGGSPLDHSAVYDVIEEPGATIVAEDHCWGERVLDLPLESSSEPMTALAQRFHRRPACSIGHPLNQAVTACIARASRAAVDAAIFYVFDQDWTANWECPSQISRFEASDIPILHLPRQAYAVDGRALQTLVAGFLASLPARRDAPLGVTVS